MINYEILLDIIIKKIAPLTKKKIIENNKIFGGAILNKSDLSVIAIGTNLETLNPLFHGEISTILSFYNKKNSINTKDCIFLSTHEPCSLCLSAITWCGFDNFYFFYPYSDTNNKFNIPHDLKILSQIFNIKKGKYNKNNSYWKSYSIINEIKKLPIKNQKFLDNKILKIDQIYSDLSKNYQNSKYSSKIPLN